MTNRTVWASAMLLAVLALGSLPLAAAFGGKAAGQTAGIGTAAADSQTDWTQKLYTSAEAGKNALRIAGTTVALHNIRVEKTAGETSDVDSTSEQAALMVTQGAQADIRRAKITASAPASRGVVGTGAGTVLEIADSSITTTGDRSDGLQNAAGATTTADSLTVTTAGNYSSAVRADGDGGVLTVQGGVYTSGGAHSPAIYAAGSILVQDATLTANNSEALVLEGGQTLTLENCTVRGNMNGTLDASREENLRNVLVYRPDTTAQRQAARLLIQGGSLQNGSGDLFYLTNVWCQMELDGVTIQDGGDGVLLRVTGNDGTNGWGQAGDNGARAEILAKNQVLEGDILVDTISTMSLTLAGNSSLTGSIQVLADGEAVSPLAGTVSVQIDPGCRWTLTADSVVSTLVNNGTIEYNGHTITLADGTVLSS